MITCARAIWESVDMDVLVFIALSFSGIRFIAARSAKNQHAPFDEKFNRTLFVAAMILFCVALVISLVELLGPLC